MSIVEVFLTINTALAASVIAEGILTASIIAERISSAMIVIAPLTPIPFNTIVSTVI